MVGPEDSIGNRLETYIKLKLIKCMSRWELVCSYLKIIYFRDLLMTMDMIYFFPTMNFLMIVSIRLFGVYSHRITEV